MTSVPNYLYDEHGDITTASHPRTAPVGAPSQSRLLLIALGALGGVLALICLLWLAADGHVVNVSAALEATPTTTPNVEGALSADAAKSLDGAEIASWPMQVIPTEITCDLVMTTTDRAPTGNYTFTTAASIANYTEQALVEGDQGDLVEPTPDFYRLDNAQIGSIYTVQAKPDQTTNYNLGIIVYNADRVPIITDTDTFQNNFASVTLVPDSFGPYYFKVFQISEQCSGHTYSLILGRTDPTNTPTPTPTGTATAGPTPTPQPEPTWMTGFDQYEPNFGFNVATTIAPGLSYQMNFVPWGNADVDNDFLKVRVKPGLQLTCETSDLDPGVDPRIALYSGPNEESFVMANDDIALGDFNSRVSYNATHEGYVYLLVGQGERMSRRDTVNSNYTISCQLTIAGAPLTPGAPATLPPADKGPGPTATPRATPRPTQPTSPLATPTEPSTTATPTPTPEPGATATPTTETSANVELAFRLVSSPEPATATPEPNGFRTFRALVFYDENMDGEMGAGEGVTGFFVLVLTPDGNEELAQGYTDEQGQLSFTVPTVGTVRILVPLLGYDRLIEASKPEVRVRIVPPVLPETIP